MKNQSISQVVKMADKIVVDSVKGKKVTLRVSWFDVKGSKKSKKFELSEKDKIEF